MIRCGNGLDLIDLVIDRYRLLIDELSHPWTLSLLFAPPNSVLRASLSAELRRAFSQRGCNPRKNRETIQLLNTCTVHSTNYIPVMLQWCSKRVSQSPIRATHVAPKIGKNRGLEFEPIHRQVPPRTESSIVDRPCPRRSGKPLEQRADASQADRCSDFEDKGRPWRKEEGQNGDGVEESERRRGGKVARRVPRKARTK